MIWCFYKVYNSKKEILGQAHCYKNNMKYYSVQNDSFQVLYDTYVSTNAISPSMIIQMSHKKKCQEYMYKFLSFCKLYICTLLS